MNIRKIVRVYFGFIMMLMIVSVLTVNEDFEKYLISVFHVDATEALKMSDDAIWNMDFTDQDAQKYVVENSDYSVVLKIQGVGEQRFVSPGSDDKEVMVISFGSLEEMLLVKEIKFKIEGVNSKLIKNVKIFKGDQVTLGEIDGDYVTFRKVDLKVDPGFTKELKVVASLSSMTHPGQRIRFDIEKPEDLILFHANKRYTLSAYYPIKGEYLTVANVVLDDKDELEY